MARYLAEPDVADIRFGDVMHALSDDARLHILALLADGEYHPCNPEGLRIDLHKSTLSHHKRILREAGVTRTRLDGRNYHICLRRDALDARFPGLLDAVLAGARETVGQVL
jgi:DNA-binding transcriptional ArsR family regulator